MFDRLSMLLQHIATRARDLRPIFEQRLIHLRRGWRYACHALSDLDAQALFFESVHCTGWYPLMILTVSETFEQARQEYDYHPILWDLLANACADVAASGGEDGDRLAQARALAIRNAVQLASQGGIILYPRTADPAEFADDGGGTS